MQDEDKIFRTYALKRLQEDVSFEHRENIDPSDFHLQQSESLDYLAKETGLTLSEVSPRWITEEPDDDEFNHYRDEKERIYCIPVSDILDARAKDIKAIVNKLPNIASKIQTFEQQTKYLYAPALSSREKRAEALLKLKPLFNSGDQTDLKIKILIDKHLYALGVNLKPKAQEQTIEVAKEDKKQTQFYDLISQIYTAPNEQTLIRIYAQLYQLAGEQNPQDVMDFMKANSYQLTSPLKGRIKKELKRDIAEQMVRLSHAVLRKSNADWWQQELDAYNKKKKKSKHKRRILGPQGAFAKGGLYGPDSKFAPKAKQTTQNTSSQQTQTIQSSSQQKPEKPKSPKIIEPLLFSDKDFEY